MICLNTIKLLLCKLAKNSHQGGNLTTRQGGNKTNRRAGGRS